MSTLLGQSHQQSLYRPAFARNCLALLVCAHGRLAQTSLQNAEEPHITGEIIREAQALVESDEAEPWMEHLVVNDDPPQNVPGRFGKRRPRIDFEFVHAVRGRRPRFHIEAKRLYRSDSVNEYFGSEGLGMFVSGSYAQEWPSAGMLGYIQIWDRATWLNKLADGLSARKVLLRLDNGTSDWVPAGWSGDGLDDVKTSCHVRSGPPEDPIEIHHLLLVFC